MNKRVLGELIPNSRMLHSVVDLEKQKQTNNPKETFRIHGRKTKLKITASSGRYYPLQVFIPVCVINRGSEPHLVFESIHMLAYFCSIFRP